MKKLLFLILVVVGCAETEKGNGRPAPANDETGEVFVLPCEPMQGGSGYLQSLIIDFSKTPAPLISKSENFAASDCSGAAYMVARAKGTATFLGLDDNQNVKTDAFVDQLEMTVHDPAVVTYFNSNSYCGYNDWQVGVTKSLVGRDCGGYTFNPQTTYSITRRTDTTLQLGRASSGHEGTSPGQRHVELDPTVFQKK